MTDHDITEAPTVIVTGPTRGLGLETTRALVQLSTGLDVLLVGRLSQAMEQISSEIAIAQSRPHIIACDFSDLDSVRSASTEIAGLIDSGAVTPISSLVANAGLQTIDRNHVTKQGYELTFGVNVLAQQVLTNELLDHFELDARIILVGSGTHRDDRKKAAVALPRWEDPASLCQPGVGDDAGESAAGQRAYATSKLCVNYLVHELDRRHGGKVVALVHDPGMMPGTGLARDMSAARRLAWEKVMPRLNLPGSSTPQRSGRVLAEMALGLKFADARGGYVDIDELGEPSPQSFNPEREAQLWEACIEMARSAS